MPNLNQPTRLLIMLTTIVAILAAPAPAFASDCLDLDKTACERQASCTWVDPYKRMDGVKVSGFCRNKQNRNTEPRDG